MPKTKTLSKPKSGKANRKKTSRRPRKGGLSLFGPKKELTPMEQKEENLKRDIKLTERYIKEKANEISSLTRRLKIAYHKKGQRKGRLGILRDISELPPRIEALHKQKKRGNNILEQQVYKLRTLHCPRCTDGTVANQCSDGTDGSRVLNAPKPRSTKSSHSFVADDLHDHSDGMAAPLLQSDSELAGWDQSRH